MTGRQVMLQMWAPACDGAAERMVQLHTQHRSTGSMMSFSYANDAFQNGPVQIFELTKRQGLAESLVAGKHCCNCKLLAPISPTSVVPGAVQQLLATSHTCGFCDRHCMPTARIYANCTYICLLHVYMPTARIYAYCTYICLLHVYMPTARICSAGHRSRAVGTLYTLHVYAVGSMQ